VNKGDYTGYFMHFIVLSYNRSILLYYVEQLMYNMYINKEFYIVSTSTCFNSFASYAWSFIFYWLKLQNQ